jgi:hypothetical protein
MVPAALPTTPEELIAGAPRAIAHLRAQLERKRLGLLFGAGVSSDFKFPKWPTLVERIARHQGVQGSALLRKLNSAKEKSLASLTQVLFGRFRERHLGRRSRQPVLTFLDEQKIRSDWLKLIHTVLYEKVDLAHREDSFRKHPYLMSFLTLIKQAPMTVNYNFDDTLEQLLLLNRTPEETLTTRGYETVFRPNAQFQKDSGVIYHPNGYLPSVFYDGSSPDIVFADDSFQDQLISAAAGQYTLLSNFLFRNTCLLIGLSLTDTTLQHLLRQSAVTNPGHVHYLVHFVESAEQYDANLFESIFDANFSAYNLLTLFLDRQGISLLGEVVSTQSAALPLRFPKGRHKFVYYIVGSIGAGKSTAASNFCNLTTYDEWIDPRRPDMAIPEKRLSRREVEEINLWTAEQFRKKNVAVSQKASGIHVIDRSPLDPLTFGKPAERTKKARHLYSTITNCGRDRLQKGHVILLDADLADIKNRMSLKHKYWDEQDLKDLLENIEAVYSRVPKTVLCTRGRSIQQVTRELARVIFMGRYQEIDLGHKLRRFAERRRRKGG